MAITSLKSTRDFVRIWFYWKIPAILIFCLIVVSVGFYSFTATPMYQSTAKIMVLPKPNDESVITPAKDSRQYLSQPVSTIDINNEVELLKSKVVISNTVEYYSQTNADSDQSAEKQGVFSFLDKFNPTKTPLSHSEKKRKALLGSLNVDPAYNSNMISVSLASPYQHQVAEVLNKLLESYLTYRKKTFSVGDTEMFYGEQKDFYGKKLTEALNKYKNFTGRWNIVNMESQTGASIQLISDFQTTLKNLEIQIAENQAKINLLGADDLKIKDEKLVLSREMRSMPVIIELARSLVPLLIKRTEISKTFTKKSREYKQINAQIAMLRHEILLESRNAAKTENLENQTLKIKKDVIEKQIEDLKLESQHFQEKREEHDELQLEVALARGNFLKYGEKKEDSRLFAMRDESNLSNVVIAEAATTPSRPKSPNTILALQVSIILGLFAALILPFILETIDHKLKTADDVENILSVPVVCSYNEV
jgi:uncharacterized protein involved in exopolysaccharide biosynthesis